MFALFRRVLVGRPIASYHADRHRFGLFGGLAVLASDALSSVAYATEEVLRVLMVGGIAALSLGRPISLLIAGLLLVVVFSYRKTIQGRRAPWSAASARSSRWSSCLSSPSRKAWMAPGSWSR